ncbi:alanyl-tRNA editing protein [Leeia oryzae]|uniref:alanyl-tRNA editing protein n=1 Tax=Leeia oryzae TaxID=356662 RepID=UPI00037F54E5|nr:alanyl-tRNA editing protein [Leeia oryzae]
MTIERFATAPYQTHCQTRVTAIDGQLLSLAETVFYAMGGGQPGDTGYIEFADGERTAIIDTRRAAGTREIQHHLAPEGRMPHTDEEITVHLDWERRYAHMRIHTALHLLTAVLPYGVTGGSVASQSGRLDFDAGDAVLDKDAIEAALNQLIEQAIPVETRWVSGDELAARPELIKTMSVKPPMGLPQVRLVDIAGTDLQPCGGTHVANTREIGPIKVLKLENKGARNRRVTIGF